jgi:hypothetical protein
MKLILYSKYLDQTTQDYTRMITCHSDSPSNTTVFIHESSYIFRPQIGIMGLQHTVLDMAQCT